MKTWSLFAIGLVVVATLYYTLRVTPKEEDSISSSISTERLSAKELEPDTSEKTWTVSSSWSNGPNDTVDSIPKGKLIPVGSAKNADRYPSGNVAKRKDAVISPYQPYNALFINGLESGELAYDSTTIPIDPATGNQLVAEDGSLDVTRAKILRVP